MSLLDIINRAMLSHNATNLLTKRISNYDIETNTPLSRTENNHQRPSVEFSKSFRKLFTTAKQRKETELTMLSKKLVNGSETTETIASTSNTARNHDICLFSDSPHYIVRIAGTGNTDEFEHLIRDDPAKLKVANPSGLCAAHNAAARNRVGILALIAQYHEGILIE
ncbi:unnamed protein product [Rotaria socialis]|uniref:Uncharacterized protein n=1 Tax=Rotaria socialis TaxID=392032 RepID=A0A818EFK9_9BILA|nr:unnamed protein product [Rotaria socialis]